MSISKLRPRTWIVTVIVLAALTGAAAAWYVNRGARSAETENDAAPQSVTSSQGPITITMTADPGTVTLDRDVLLLITVSAPSEMDVRLPDLTDRLKGFTVSGQYDRETEQEPGRVLRETHVRLTPVIADTYRVSPMAITYLDRSSSPPREG